MPVLTYKLQPADLRHIRMDVKCPACGHRFCEAVSHMRPGQTKACPRCGATMRFVADELPPAIKAAFQKLVAV
jgi:ribosomal protein S27E